MNLMLILDMAASGFGERVAVGDAHKGMTYAELYELAGKTAAWLRTQPGERLLYTDVASPVLPVALFGASWAGLPYTPLNYRLSDDRLRSLVERQAPATLICGAGTEPRVAGIDGVGVLAAEDLLATVSGQEVPQPDWANDPEDIGVLLHTSGTSGEPKVAVLRQKHLVSYVFGSVEFMGAGEDEATLVTVPPYHIAGTAAVLTSVYTGRRIIQLPSFEPKEWVQVAREQRVTHAMVVPTMLARVLDVLEDGQGLPDLRHLSYGGGRMPLPVIERALELIPHVNFVNAYGLTETSSSIAVLSPDDHREALASDDPAARARLGSVGRPLPTVVIEIRDPDGNPVPPGERGEIWVSGEQVSGEYAKRGSGGADGWFQTNDGGFFDEEGFLFVEGRLDDVIVRGGENLSPGEIEDVLLHHDTVLEACVVGVPDDEWGEVVAAVVVLNDDSKATEDELSEWVVAHLRSSRRPSIVEFRTELPYSDTGKVLRRVLREELSRAHQPVSGPDLRELVDDLVAEQSALDQLVTPLPPDDWRRPTPAEGWAVADQIHHLGYFERAGVLAVTDADAFVAHRRAFAQDPEGFERERREEVRRLGPDVLVWWRAGRAELLDALGGLAAGTRLPWYGPPMAGPSFVTARLMETWAHGQDVADALGLVRPTTARLRHVAHLGARTRRFSYEVRGLQPPDHDVRVELDGPGGERWAWGPLGAPDHVSGPALDFCLVVTQRRHPASTSLSARGPHAAEWLAIAQAFAGPPGRGRPAPAVHPG